MTGQPTSRRLPVLRVIGLMSLLATGSLATPWAVSTAEAARIPSVKEIESGVLSALGGSTRLAELHSLRASGTLEGLEGFPGSYEFIAEAPASRKETWDIRYLRQTTAVTDTQGWEQTSAPDEQPGYQGVRELAGNELARDQRGARFNDIYVLIRQGDAASVEAGKCEAHGPKVYLLTFTVSQSNTETYGIDPKTHLPACRTRVESYVSGPETIRTEYSDYRSLEGLMLPFSIIENRPDDTLKIRITRYEINPALDPDVFANPEAAHLNGPMDVEISTTPKHVYKEPDGRYTLGPQRLWGMHFYSSESWYFDLVVKERYGRYVAPVSARIDFYSGATQVGSQSWTGETLTMMARHPVARFWPLGDIFGIRHNIAMPANLNVNRMVYTLTVKRGDALFTKSLSIPVTVYVPKVKLVFPMKGKFMVMSGHEYYETEHSYERSQHFAIDIVALGRNFEFAKHDGATMQDYYGYAHRVIIAPAAGRVVYARNDVPDGAVKKKFLKMKDGLQAIAGNLVIIDHGHGEYSLFAHMHQGSVLVKTGEHVKQGQPIGLLGAAGSPGLPHLHYQLQDGPRVFGADGLPLEFTNIERVGWLGAYGSKDEHAPAPVSTPPDGVYMEAK
jgi:Peptidase family M23